jgi:hypothetical protein
MGGARAQLTLRARHVDEASDSVYRYIGGDAE